MLSKITDYVSLRMIVLKTKKEHTLAMLWGLICDHLQKDFELYSLASIFDSLLNIIYFIIYRI
jgi:hypothetical protein